MTDILTVDGIECYEESGTVFLKLEAVARGLGFTTTQTINGLEYTNVRWSRVDEYLKEINFATSGKRPKFIPENIFYRLAMKAKNETAEKFQVKVADEIIPSIRRHGAYMTPNALDKMIRSPEFGIKLLTALKDEQDKRKALEIANSELTVDNQIMKPKADYFDDLVDRNLLTSFRDTAKQLGLKERKFIQFLLDHKYIYRDKGGKLKPYANKNNGLFELKEFVNEKTGFTSTQTLITPKGRETFRLLCLKTIA